MEMYPYWLRHYIWVDPILNFFFYRRVKFTYKKYTDVDERAYANIRYIYVGYNMSKYSRLF